jgi:hypothetical protein
MRRTPYGPREPGAGAYIQTWNRVVGAPGRVSAAVRKGRGTTCVLAVSIL